MAVCIFDVFLKLWEEPCNAIESIVIFIDTIRWRPRLKEI